MKAVIMTSNRDNANRIFTTEIRNELRKKYELYESVLSKRNMEKARDFLQETEYIFATWGMERFTKEQIKAYFPALRCIFYAAGSVQEFAEDFLDCGVRVFSAWQANAVPVAEYAYAQIILAAKGFYQAARRAKYAFYPAAKYSERCGGNYRAKVGIIGVGSIGSLVAEKLRANDVKVMYYDPFLTEERAAKLNIAPASLAEIFSQCDVITNHLANKKELTNVLSGDLFALMKPYAAFINTGRGAQVDEKGLAKAMRKVRTRTALLDVTAHEPVSPFNRLARLKNVVVTPHIAGSNGREVVRMAKYMLEEAARIDTGEPAKYEVSREMLTQMA